MNTGKKQFNMQGYLIEFDYQTHSWSWNKWESHYSADGQKQVIRHGGGLEFMKMFTSLIDNSTLRAGIIETQKQMDEALKKFGTDYIFLYQGESVLEKEFQTVEEAENFYLGDCSVWDLTDYWFAYDGTIQSWGMFDAFTGDLQFTPQSKEKELKPRPRQHQRRHTAVNRYPGFTSDTHNISYH